MPALSVVLSLPIPLPYCCVVSLFVLPVLLSLLSLLPALGCSSTLRSPRVRCRSGLPLPPTTTPFRLSALSLPASRATPPWRCAARRPRASRSCCCAPRTPSMTLLRVAEVWSSCPVARLRSTLRRRCVRSIPGRPARGCSLRAVRACWSCPLPSMPPSSLAAMTRRRSRPARPQAWKR